MVVVFDVEAAEADGEQAGTQRIGVEVVVDVGGVHDGSEAHEGRVAGEFEVVDEDLEGAAAVAVVELGPGRVEAVCVLVAGDGENIVVRDVEDLGGGVDEPSNQPRASNAVGLGTGAG